MQRVLTCLAHPRMSACDSHTLLLTPATPLLPPCETALLLAQVPQASLIVPGVGDLLPGGEGRQVCNAEVHPYQFARACTQWAAKLRAEAHGVRPRRIPREAHHVGALDIWKLFSESQSPELRQTQCPRAPPGADALKPKTLAAALAFETWIPCIPGKEVTESPVLIPQALCEGG